MRSQGASYRRIAVSLCGGATLLTLWACDGDRLPARRETASEAGSPSVMDPPVPAKLPSVAPTRRLRRLSAREYDNVVRDLLGDDTAPATHFVGDAFQNGYDNGSAGLAVQSDQVLDYQAAAEALAARSVQEGLSELVGGCDPVAQGEAACAEAFFERLVPRAFRRPATATELERLRQVYRDGAEAAGFQTGIQTALEAILQSPQFLYREELGPLDAETMDAAPEVSLTPNEIASELSFLLTGSIPDDELRRAVAEGRFSGAADYEREARRLLTTPGARAALRAFLNQWLATDRLATLTKDAATYPSFGPELAQSMSEELTRYFDDVLWAGSGSLSELFTSSQSFVDARLANLYGVTPPETGFRATALDAKLRQGVLTRAGFLAVHAATDSSGPVARGVFTLQALMCAPPPAPPPNVPPAVPAHDPSVQALTTRQRFGQHSASAFCSACHARIDGVGFGFEQFDGIGSFRNTEKDQPVDSTGELIGTSEIDGPFDGVSELSQKLAGSRTLRDCFVRQAYRYALGQIEAKDDGAVSELSAEFSSERPLTELLVQIVKSPLFSQRRVEPAEAP